MGKEIPKEKKKKIEELAKEGATYKEISKEVGVSQGCAYNYGKKYKQHKQQDVNFLQETDEVFTLLYNILPQEKKKKAKNNKKIRVFAKKLRRRLG